MLRAARVGGNFSHRILGINWGPRHDITCIRPRFHVRTLAASSESPRSTNPDVIAPTLRDTVTGSPPQTAAAFPIRINPQSVYAPEIPAFLEPICAAASSYLEGVHWIGMPWVGTLLLSAFIVRTCMIPLVIWQQRRMHAVSLVTTVFSRPLMLIVPSFKFTSTWQKVKFLVVARSRLVRKFDAQLYKLIVPFATNTAILVTISMGVRRLAPAHPELATGGILWFTDLTATDPLTLLPFINAVIAYSLSLGVKDPHIHGVVERLKSWLLGTPLRVLQIKPEASALMSPLELMQNVMRLLSIAIWPLTSALPAAVNVYMFGSLTWSFAQMRVTRHPWVRANVLKIDPRPLSEEKKNEGMKLLFSALPKELVDQQAKLAVAQKAKVGPSAPVPQKLKPSSETQPKSKIKPGYAPSKP